MTQEPPDREALRTQYDAIHHKYEKLEESLKRDLNTFFDEAGISVLSIESRLKQFGSFSRKVELKRCENPLEDIQDICGVRVICYYPSDLEPVSEVVERNFKVIESENKADSLRTGEFGYRSRHFVVTPKEHALRTASYQGLDDLKAEIQVRTIFDHAWAELSHELDYKKEGHAPKEFQRRLHQLNAMLENLDQQFDDMHQRKALYIRKVSEEAEQLGRFDLSQELNIDTLQAFLDFYFPDRERLTHYTDLLLNIIDDYDVSMPQLAVGIESVKDFLPAIDSDMQAGLSSAKLSQQAVMKAILELTNDNVYQASRSNARWSRVINHWRRKLSERNRR